METKTYCGTYNQGCGASLTESDFKAGYCTQCLLSLEPESLPLEHALLLSLREVESQRAERDGPYL